MDRPAVNWLCAALSSALLAAPALAQTPVPLGPDFQVNTATTSEQLIGGVAMAAGGDFVVTWTSFVSETDPDDTDPDDSSIQGQRYAADGSAEGTQFQTDTTTGLDVESSVSMAADGDFVVAWSEIPSFVFPDADAWDVLARRYDADGTPAGTPFDVNSTRPESQLSVDVGSAADGRFVVVWETDPDSGPDSIGARIFDASGSPIAGDFTLTESGSEPAVAVAPSGDFVVVWSSLAAIGTDTSSWSVQARRYDADGSPLGAAFQVNTLTTGAQRDADVAAAPDGGFVVVWTHDAAPGMNASDPNVQGQRYAADGAAAGGEFPVNTATLGLQSTPSVAVAPDGSFVVVWQGHPLLQDPEDFDLFGQRFAPDGTPRGLEFQVNTHTQGLQTRPDVAAGNDGFAVAWTSESSPGTDVSGQSVLARRYRFGAATAVPSLSAPLAAPYALLLLGVGMATLRRR